MQPTAHTSTPVLYSLAPNNSSGARYHLCVCVCVCVRACVHVCVCGENSRIHDNKMKVPLTLPCINNQDTTTIWQGRMARPFPSVHSSWPTKPRHLNFIIFIHFTATTDVHSMKGYTPQRKDHSRSLTYHPGSPALFAQL